jgi:hypothetical protein
MEKVENFHHPGHDAERLQFSHRNVEVTFLPLITISIMQPLDQGRIKDSPNAYMREIQAILWRSDNVELCGRVQVSRFNSILSSPDLPNGSFSVKLTPPSTRI